MCGVVMV